MKKSAAARDVYASPAVDDQSNAPVGGRFSLHEINFIEDKLNGERDEKMRKIGLHCLLSSNVSML